MKTVWKYPLIIDGTFVITMPKGSEVLTVQIQDGVPCLWALVDPSQPKEARHFALTGTGHARDDLDEAVHVGTFQMRGGDLVFHVFDLMPT